MPFITLMYSYSDDNGDARALIGRGLRHISLEFKMANSRFVSVTKEMVKTVEKNSESRRVRGCWLLILIRVLKTIKTELYQHQNEYLQHISKAPQLL